MEIFERIRAERERLGLSQTVFADKIGSTKRSVINWESGNTSPSADILAAIASIGGDVIYILTGEGLQEALDFRPIKQAALQAHKAANAMGKVTDRQFLGIFTAMLDGVVDVVDEDEDKNDNKKSVTQTSNASATVQIGGNNSGTVNDGSKGRKRK